MNIDDIIEDIERCIDDIKEINNAPDDERNEILSKLQAVSDTLNNWADEGIGTEEDDELDEDDFWGIIL